jgi:hypothetical protein
MDDKRADGDGDVTEDARSALPDGAAGDASRAAVYVGLP